MKSFRFSSMLILVVLLAACGPVQPLQVVPQTSPTADSKTAVLIWERTGGFAGFCDLVIISETGFALVANCKGNWQTQIQLIESQRKQLADWQKNFQVIDYRHEDPAVADSMSISLLFAGRGDKEADEETIRLLSAFAADVQAIAAYAQNAPPEKVEAEQALRDYLEALHTGDYILAAKLYGGETDILETWNSDITNDLPALFERGCAQNGLMCLAPRTLTYRGTDADVNYQFIVEFTSPDGTLFVQGPCCGEEIGATLSSFIFRVKKIESGFVVLDLPPYVP